MCSPFCASTRSNFWTSSLRYDFSRLLSSAVKDNKTLALSLGLNNIHLQVDASAMARRKGCPGLKARLAKDQGLSAICSVLKDGALGVAFSGLKELLP